MSRLRAMAARLRSVGSRRRLEDEFDDELREHLALATDEGIRRGLSPQQAQAAARRALGGLTQTAEVRRDGRRLPFIETVWQDFRYAQRVIASRPQFAAAAVLVLALGIGSVTACFAVVDALLLRPLPYPTPERLFHLDAIDPSAANWPLPQPDVLDIQQRSRAITIAGWQSRTLAVDTGDGPQQVPGAAVTASFFDLIGRRAHMGRTFAASDDRPGGCSPLIRPCRRPRQRTDPEPAFDIAGLDPTPIVNSPHAFD